MVINLTQKYTNTMTDFPIDPTANFAQLAAARAITDLAVLIEGGATLTQAADWYATRVAGRSISEWASVRDVDKNRIEDNATRVDVLIRDGQIDETLLPA